MFTLDADLDEKKTLLIFFDFQKIGVNKLNNDLLLKCTKYKLSFPKNT